MARTPHALTYWARLIPLRWGLALAIVLGLLPTCLAAADENALEAKVKAAYLFHLTKFVEWPGSPTSEMRICVVGSGSVGDMIGQLGNRQVRDRPLKIETGSVSDPTQCQILYIGKGDRRLSDLLRRVRGQNVLTVSDQEDFARHGGILGFYTEAGKIKLEINPESVRATDLKISAKLLELARNAQ